MIANNAFLLNAHIYASLPSFFGLSSHKCAAYIKQKHCLLKDFSGLIAILLPSYNHRGKLTEKEKVAKGFHGQRLRVQYIVNGAAR